MAEQILLQKLENSPQFSTIFTEPSNARLLRLKQENSMTISEEEKYDYNYELGDQAKALIIELQEKVNQVRLELKKLRNLNKSNLTKEDRYSNINKIVELSNEQDNLPLKEASIIEEMLKLEMV